MSKFLFGCYPGEDISWLPGASVDLITIDEAIHWTEHENILESASVALKPGGMLAIWINGTLPFFVTSTRAQGIRRSYERWLERIKISATLTQLARSNRAVRTTQLRMDVIQFDSNIQECVCVCDIIYPDPSRTICRLQQLYVSVYVHVKCSTS
jgi:trans-aconitate methyltransferase